MNSQDFDMKTTELMSNIAKLQAETMRINKEIKYDVLGLLLGAFLIGGAIASLSALLTWHFIKC